MEENPLLQFFISVLKESDEIEIINGIINGLDNESILELMIKKE